MCDKTEIKQAETGYRYSIDPFLLADFIPSENFRSAIDLGTGNGILIRLLQKVLTNTSFSGIDIQREPLLHARTNCEGPTAPSFLQCDIRDAKNLFKPGSFDLAISNPPYRKKKSGRINRIREIAIARHELMLTLEELVEAACHLLNDGGRFCLVHLSQRSAEVIQILKNSGFAPEIMRFVHSKEREDAFLVMITAVKNGNNPVTVKHPLIVYGNDGNVSAETDSIYQKFET